MLLAVRRCWWVLAVAAVLLARPALACKCGEDRWRGLVRPLWPPESGLLLTSESIEVDCNDEGRCHWRSVHVYERASPGAPARVAFNFPLSLGGQLQLSLGGQLVLAPKGEARDQVEAAITEHLGGFESYGNRYWLEDDGTQTRVELVIEGDVYLDYGPSLDPDGYDFECCHYNALEIRHPFVPTYTSHRRLAWRDEKSTSVDPKAKTQLRVRPPAKYHVRADPGLDAVRHGDTYEIRGRSQSGVGLSLIRWRSLKGGPFIAAGGAILDANPARGRIGWEHTHPLPFLFYSAALETDFQREFTAVPAIEISHGRGSIWWFVPIAGLGVGVPVQILPDPRPGVRGQFSLSWRVFSFLTTFDVLPALRTTDAGVERPTLMKLAFLGQFSF
ncbi:MAG TPA: hypothetical protein VM869_17165 [Enhygromyxa sp.]|nr:hypothetical protein [Enhygromyxa sp.]